MFKQVISEHSLNNLQTDYNKSIHDENLQLFLKADGFNHDL